MKTIKIAVSNIAWETSRMDEFLAILARSGCDLEFSPSMVWPEPIEASSAEVEAFGRRVREWGLKLCSMHSLTYPRPDLTFFDGEPRRRDLIAYIIALGHLARRLGIPHMVFGSARSRQIGNRDRGECGRVLVETFREMAEGLVPLGVQLLVEPLGRSESDSITSVMEGASLVEKVAHPNFGLHIDLRSTFTENEDQDQFWSSCISQIRHCHVADPGMKPPSAACPGHFAAASAMKRAGYGGYVSIEIGRCRDTETLEQAIRFVQNTYAH